MNNCRQFYKFWRKMSIAMMAVVVVIMLANTLMASSSFATSNSSVTKICNYKGIHFCLVMPADGSVPLAKASHSAEPTVGFT